MHSTGDGIAEKSMKRPTARKLLDYVGTAFVITGMLLLMGSVVVWVIGPELLSGFYERSKPVIPFFLAGLVLLVLGILIAPSAGMSNAAASGAPCCGKCAAPNESLAKFCNQCGTAL